MVEIFGVETQEIENAMVDEDTMVLIVNYKTHALMRAATRRNPGLLNCIYQTDVDMEPKNFANDLALKIRQIPVTTDMASLLAINGLNESEGSHVPTKGSSKKVNSVC